MKYKLVNNQVYIYKSISDTNKNKIVPIHYKILIIPDNNTFRGLVNMKIKVIEDTNIFFLNTQNISINNVQITNNNFIIENRDIIIKESSNIEETTEFTINQNILKSGEEYIIQIKYTGIITKDMMGFYKSRGFEPNKYIYCTKFEPQSARRLVPCIDEPCFKATFELILIIKNSQEALSNTNIKSQEIINKKYKKIIFSMTPKMSIYLLAFVVFEKDDINYQEIITKNNIRIRTYYPHFRRECDSLFSLKYTKIFLDYMTDYFGEKYPLDKIDLFPIPEFAAGAMENYGLITFKPEILLVDEYMNKQNQINMLVTIVHELVHQWMGNLVTIKYWNELWLNEGLTTYFSYFFIDKLMPELNICDSFYKTKQNIVLNIDNLKVSSVSSIITYNELYKSQNITFEDMFNSLVYLKGTSVFKYYVDNYITEPILNESIKKYVQAYKYDNPNFTDFLKYFPNSAKLSKLLINKNFQKYIINNNTVVSTESIYNYIIKDNFGDIISNNSLDINKYITYRGYYRVLYDKQKILNLINLLSKNIDTKENIENIIYLNKLIEDIFYFYFNYDNYISFSDLIEYSLLIIKLRNQELSKLIRKKFHIIEHILFDNKNYELIKKISIINDFDNTKNINKKINIDLYIEEYDKYYYTFTVKNKLLKKLCNNVTNTEDINKLLLFVFSDKLDIQDMIFFVEYFCEKNITGKYFVCDYIKNNFEYIYKLINNEHLFAKLLHNIIKHIYSLEYLESLENMLEKYDNINKKLIIQQSFEEARIYANKKIII